MKQIEDCRDIEPIEFVKAKYLGYEETCWKDAFSGFDEFYGVTFSYGLSFIDQLSDYFEHMELVIGNSVMAKNDIKELIAQQAAIQNECILAIKRHPKLMERVCNQTMKVFLVKEANIHSKFYILKANDGRTRVITGSGNLSRRAFDNNQMEQMIIFDNDPEAFEYFMELFEMVLVFSTDNVTENAIPYKEAAADSEPESFDELPIGSEVKVKNEDIIVREPIPSEVQKTEFVTAVETSTDYYKRRLPAFDKNSKKVRLTAQHIHRIMENTFLFKKAQEDEISELPGLIVDIDAETVFLYKEPLDLETNPKQIKKELAALEFFFNGYREFDKYEDRFLNQYFLVMNYMLMAPFVALFRRKCVEYNFAPETAPIILIVNGPKSAGKTHFIEMVDDLMIKNEIREHETRFWTADKFTKVLIRSRFGLPVLVDDLPGSRHETHTRSIAKERTEQIFSEKSIKYHPTFVITSNEIKSLSPDVEKRVPYFEIDMTIPDVKHISGAKSATSYKKKFRQAFYKEYLKRMIPKVQECFMKIETYTETESSDWIPDLLAISSQVIVSIWKDFGDGLPFYVKEVNCEDYYGVDRRSYKIRKEIKDRWEQTPEDFEVNKKQNKLIFKASSEEEAIRIFNLLNESLQPDRYNCKLVMKLDLARDILGINFKKRRRRLFLK